MTRTDWSPLWTLEPVLAVLVFAIAVVTVTAVPQPYPTWPTVGPVPANPELVVPGVLGTVAMVRVVTDPGVGSTVVGAVGAITLLLAVTSVHTLYVGAGGVFFGGLFTLLAGIALAAVVLLRAALSAIDLSGVQSRVAGLAGGA